jgi:hypothetical protein
MQPEHGQSSCVKCSIGYFQEDEAGLTCLACPAGKYQSKTGQGYCVGNPAGMSVKLETTEHTTMTLEGIQLETFNSLEVQVAFRQKIANQLGVDVSFVQLGNISDITLLRRRLADAITFSVTITLHSEAAEQSQLNVSSQTTSEPVQQGFAFASLVQDSNKIVSLIRAVYNDQNIPISDIEATASTPLTTSRIVELACTPGTFFPPGTSSSECSPCPSGKYQHQIGAEHCIGCEIGQIQRLEGQSSCTACPAGSYHHMAAQLCLQCPIAMYQDEPGQTMCKACQERTSTLGVGSATITECKCVVGFMWCPSGSPASPGEASLCATQLSRCIRCPVGANCTLFGTTLMTAASLAGNWRATPNSTAWHECGKSLAGDERCRGGAVQIAAQSGRPLEHEYSTDAQCKDGHAGLLCSTCDAKHDYHDQFGDCVNCSNSTKRAVSILILAALALLVFFAMIFVYKKAQKDPAKVQEAFDSRNMTFKILMTFVQILVNLKTTFRISFPIAVLDFFRFMSFFEVFDILPFTMRVGCLVAVDYWQKLYFTTAGPVLLIGVLFIISWSIHSDGIFSLALLLTFIVYSPVCKALFLARDCKMYEDGVSYLLPDPREYCGRTLSATDTLYKLDDQYKFHTWVTGGLALVVGLGFPVSAYFDFSVLYFDLLLIILY